MFILRGNDLKCISIALKIIIPERSPDELELEEVYSGPDYFEKMISDKKEMRSYYRK